MSIGTIRRIRIFQSPLHHVKCLDPGGHHADTYRVSPFAIIGILVAVFLALIVVAVLLGSPAPTGRRPARTSDRRPPSITAASSAPGPARRGRRAVLSRDEREELLASTRNLASSDPEATARLVRNWLSDDLA